jgi:predicted double-glycine peptidase
MRFWDAGIGGCFFSQETTNSCAPASVQMVLKYLDFSPLPNQTQLATEMNTDINHTTEWRYVYIPFKGRGFSEYHNQSLSNDFNRALANLKGNVSKNFPAILKIWYNEQAKSEGKVTHVVVVTGYNSTGIFIHDPWYEPNRFLNLSTFSSLWKTDSEYWAFIVKVEPTFDLIVEVKDWFGNAISGVHFALSDGNNQTDVTNLNGTVKFSNLRMASYVLSYNWRFQSDEYNVVLTKTTKVNFRLFLSNQTILGIITLFLVIVVVIIWCLRKRV